ncbi:hypothetical protein ASD00_32700 [Ensifer sp. Root31]|uniref:VirE2 family protein n=1 Tax=Ensifer sp. Root31 TaxID=1736512 RepID=UPI00070D7BF7|nr:hypothetical protein [Ensifer sp. Root31]KQU85449.1 hypothetical protein ASD00_32700 [Ensifer sp. Root31]
MPNSSGNVNAPKGFRVFVKDSDDILFGIEQEGSPPSIEYVRRSEFEKREKRYITTNDFAPDSQTQILMTGGRGDLATPRNLHHTFLDEATRAFPPGAPKGMIFGKQLSLARDAMTKARVPNAHPLMPESQGTLRNRLGEVQKTPDGKDKQARQLQGQARFYQTPGGEREKMFDYGDVSPEVSGQALPDYFVRGKDNRLVGKWRHPDDGLAGKNEQQILGRDGKELILKSQTFIAQRAENLRADGRSVEKRLNSYLKDAGYSKDTPQLLIHFGDDFWPAERVLKKFPDGAHADRLKHGPDADIPPGYPHQLSVLVKDGNHLYPAEKFSAREPEAFHKIMKGVEAEVQAEGHKITLRSQDWNYTGASYDISSNTQGLSPIFVMKGEGKDFRLSPALGLTAKNVEMSYPPERRFAAKVNRSGEPTGMWENMATINERDISEHVKDTWEELTGRRSKERVQVGRGAAAYAKGSDMELDPENYRPAGSWRKDDGGRSAAIPTAVKQEIDTKPLQWVNASQTDFANEAGANGSDNVVMGGVEDENHQPAPAHRGLEERPRSAHHGRQ